MNSGQSPFDLSDPREFPEPSTKHIKNFMGKNSDKDLDLTDMDADAKPSNPHESCLCVREENDNSPTTDRQKVERKSHGTPDVSPLRKKQTPPVVTSGPPHVILNEIDQSLWIDLDGGWRFQVKSNKKQIRNTKMIFAMFDHVSYENKNVSEEIPHARNGTFHVSYFLRNLNSNNEETDVHATYAFKNAKTKNNEKRHYGPRFNEKTKRKTFKHTGKPYCLRELLDLFDQTRPDESQIFIEHINDLKESATWMQFARNSLPMNRKSNKSGRRNSRR